MTRIIWLGEETPAEEAAADGPENGPSVLRVQALRDDGIRVTFDAEKLVGNSLEGTSDVLGTCRVDLEKIDQLMIGGAIEQAAPDLPYQRWKLRDATLPKFAQDDGEGGSTPGMESALVGKPAPRFRTGNTRRLHISASGSSRQGRCPRVLGQVGADRVSPRFPRSIGPSRSSKIGA